MADSPHARLSKRQHIRLDGSAYARSGHTWFVTITTLQRDRLLLLEPRAAEPVRASLIKAHELNGCDLLAYCVMPDHVHAVSHVRDGGDPIRLINGFKSFYTRAWWTVGGSGQLWQRSFHDRGLRTEADVEATVAYVWENPVRWGLADDDDNFPFRGGELLREP